MNLYLIFYCCEAFFLTKTVRKSAEAYAPAGMPANTTSTETVASEDWRHEGKKHATHHGNMDTQSQTDAKAWL